MITDLPTHCVRTCCIKAANPRLNSPRRQLRRIASPLFEPDETITVRSLTRGLPLMGSMRGLVVPPGCHDRTRFPAYFCPTPKLALDCWNTAEKHKRKH